MIKACSLGKQGEAFATWFCNAKSKHQLSVFKSKAQEHQGDYMGSLISTEGALRRR